MFLTFDVRWKARALSRISNSYKPVGMRLIRIISQEDSYVVHAEMDVKILGIKLFTQRKSFSKTQDSGDWYNSSSSSKVSKRKAQKLNKWIADHERFIMASKKK